MLAAGTQEFSARRQRCWGSIERTTRFTTPLVWGCSKTACVSRFSISLLVRLQAAKVGQHCQLNGKMLTDALIKATASRNLRFAEATVLPAYSGNVGGRRARGSRRLKLKVTYGTRLAKLSSGVRRRLAKIHGRGEWVSTSPLPS